MLTDYETELQQYIITALWSSTDESDDAGGMPLDDNYGPEDLAPEAREAMAAELLDFIDAAPADALAFWEAELGPGQIGHDFWLTRNRHGAGFWDRFYDGADGERYGRALTDCAHPYGESYLYVGDDGLIYVG